MRRQTVERGGEAVRRGVNGKPRLIEAPEFLGRRVDMDEIGAGARDLEQCEALRRDFSEAPAKQDRQIGSFDPRDQLGVWTKAEIPCVTRMQRVEQRAAPIARDDGQFEPLGEAPHRLNRRLAPSGAAQNEQRLARRRQ